jgi:hypothetical protein
MHTPNTSRCSRRILIGIIFRTEISSQDRGGETSIQDEVMTVVRKMILRCRAISVLRSRLRRNLDPAIIDELVHCDLEFAQMFCEKHLGRPLAECVTRTQTLMGFMN